MNGAPCPGCENERTQVFRVARLDCASEAVLIEEGLRRLEGVCSVRASGVTGKATVVHTLPAGEIERAFARLGFAASEAQVEPPRPDRAWGTLVALGLAVAGFAASALRPRQAPVLFAAAILVGGLPVARQGLRQALRRTLDMNVLMTVAVLGAMAIGEWAEAATTVVLFSLAQLLEARSLERARRAIGRLMSLAPETALVRRAAGEQRVPPSEVAPGEQIVVGPGERVALDGIVQEGYSELDESPLTGESRPAVKAPGDSAFAGSINGSGVLVLRVSRPASETTLARIIRRVEEAQASRAPSQGFVERFARVYTPAVVCLALLLAILPPLVMGTGFAEWTYRALVLLVIACPCALVISTPVSIVSALTAASRRGALVKGGAHLEAVGRVRCVAFDKTGTLTRGVPEVTDVVAAPGSSRVDVLRLAAAVERRSRHPIGAAVLEAARREGIDAPPAEEVVALAGLGVRGRCEGAYVLVGSHRLFAERGRCDHCLDSELQRLESEGKTVVLVGREVPGCGLVGVLAVADALRDEAAPAVEALHAQGLRVVLLTGDNARTADAIAERLRIGERHAGLLPEDKLRLVAAMQRESGGTAMVGDGVNDAPALAAASVGIAMGVRGSDAVLETADIALMSDELRRVPELIRLGRRTARVIRQNIALSLAVKGIVLVLALAGYGSLWAAVAADMGASLAVIGNGLRLLKDPGDPSGLPARP
jgi:Cd2+/Zn2+-exporting ATPase